MSSDQLADQFLQKTGIDLRKYRHHDLAKSLSDFCDLSLVSRKSIGIPLIISGVIASSIYAQAHTTLQTAFASIGGSIFILLNSLLIFSVLFTLRMKDIFTTLLTTTLDLANLAATDLQALQKGTHEGSLESPSFAELTSATLKIVALPLLQDSITANFPILGRVLSPLTNWLGRILEKRTLKQISSQQKTSSKKTISPGQLARYQKIANGIKDNSSPLISACTSITLFPSIVGLLVLWTVFFGLYFLIF